MRTARFNPDYYLTQFRMDRSHTWRNFYTPPLPLLSEGGRLFTSRCWLVQRQCNDCCFQSFVATHLRPSHFISLKLGVARGRWSLSPAVFRRRHPGLVTTGRVERHANSKQKAAESNLQTSFCEAAVAALAALMMSTSWTGTRQEGILQLKVKCVTSGDS